MEPTVFERLAPAPALIDRALTGVRHAPFWLEDLDAEERPAASGAAHYDLVVVGGGYTGLWSALLAAERFPGLRIAVLEAKRMGWAASGRNGGFCEASLTHGAVNGERRFPRELTTLEKMGMENLDEIEQTVSRLGLDCEFERTGAIAVAVEDHQVAELEAERELADHRFLDAAAMRAEIASPTYLAGLWAMRDTAMVHPGKLAKELARACAASGVELFEGSPVRGLDGGERIALRTDRARFTADRVVLATNAFPSLLARYRLHTIPVYDYVLMTEPLSTAQISSIGWGRRQGVADMANQFHYYRLTGDNRILFGGYDAIYHFGGRIRDRYEHREATFRMLASHFLTTFPQLEDVRFSHRWAGVIDTCSRFCVFFGRAHRDRVAYAAGFTGLGVGASRWAAQVMLDRLWGERTERTELDFVNSLPTPFPPDPAAWMGVEVSRWAMNRADHHGGRRNLVLRTLDALGLGFDS